MKKLRIFIFKNFATVLTLVAATGVSTRSIWFNYEPSIPQSLKK